MELLDSGINVNFRDIDDRTGLHVSVCQGKIEVVELLLSRGAKVDSTYRWGSTVRENNILFFYIVWNMICACVKYLDYMMTIYYSIPNHQYVYFIDSNGASMCLFNKIM